MNTRIKLSIRTKLLAAFGLVGLLMIVLGVNAISRLSGEDQHIGQSEEITASASMLASTADDLARLVGRFRLTV